jgi:type IV secretory pathway component VirB8
MDETCMRLWGAFRQRMDPENKTSPLRTYREAGMTREIHVETVTPSAYAQGIYTVDFVAVDRKGGDEIKRQVLVATIQAGFAPLELTPETVEENPIGLTIHGYEICSRDLTQPTQDPLNESPHPNRGDHRRRLRPASSPKTS